VKLVGITTRVEEHAYENTTERRDALDQQWNSFLALCSLVPVLIPNNPDIALILIKTAPLVGVVFSGGNTLQNHGGTAPERDATERAILAYAVSASFPVLGVCRGMQVIQHYFHGPLEKVPHHIGQHHRLSSGRTVNSYHDYGLRTTASMFEIKECAEDDTIEEIAHRTLPIHGIMWHPERTSPVDAQDIALFKGHFLS
jgi:putative glutamine amidotransferase